MSKQQGGMDLLSSAYLGITPPPHLAKQAWVPDYGPIYQGSISDPEGFWGAIARELDWFAPWERVLEWKYPNSLWFLGGKCNITYNCLDRHLDGPRRDKLAISWLGEDGTERKFTFEQLYSLVNKIASGLKSIGVAKGDRVCIYMPLTPEGIASMLACARIGAVHSVVYAGLGSTALRSRIEDAEAKVIMTADVGFRRGKEVNLKGIVDEAIEGLGYIEKVVVMRRTSPKTVLNGQREVDLEELIARSSPSCPPEVMNSEDPLFILYTSGTTGRPKGCVYVHGGYMVGTSYLCKIAYDLKDDDTYWCTSDIGWIVGHSSITYGPLINGTTLVVREGAPDYPDPGAFWSIVEKYRVTKIFTAPTVIRMFMKFGEEWPRKYDRSSLRILICAGEPLNPEALLWTHRVIGDEKMAVCDNWWQTETAAPTIGTLPSMVAKSGRAGKPMPGIVAEVVDREGKQVETNKGGLLVLKGPWPHMMRTIYRDPQRYEEYWNIIPGCYVAGDVATVDEEGYIGVLGRADDVLNVAGHRIGTAEVESALVGHAAVTEAAVIGKPDDIKGETIKAFVTLKVGREPSEELARELQNHVRKELGPIAVPSELEFTPKLPKTRSGKIMRRLLKANELGIEVGDITTLEE